MFFFSIVVWFMLVSLTMLTEQPIFQLGQIHSSDMIVCN